MSRSGFRDIAPGGRNSLTSLASATCLVLAAVSCFAQEQSATMLSREVKDVFERASKAVVKVHAVDEHSDIYGTGFFIDPTGTLYTCYAVGGEAENLTVQFAGK